MFPLSQLRPCSQPEARSLQTVAIYCHFLRNSTSSRHTTRQLLPQLTPHREINNMASFFGSPLEDLIGKANATTASAASPGTTRQGISSSVYASSASGGACNTAGANMRSGCLTPSSKVQEVAYEDLVAISAPSNASGGSSSAFSDTLKHPSTVIKSGTEVLRIYLPFDKLPLAWLNALLLYLLQANLSLRVHLYVRSLLRPCLQDIFEDAKLASQLTTTMRKYLIDLGTALRFFFLKPSGRLDASDCAENFVEKDFFGAIVGLQEHTVELSEILGEESVVGDQPVWSLPYLSCPGCPSTLTGPDEEEML
ncbi:hypothetical protein N0V83_001878 [Neocucurbitaria cava]|uniref:Uncharacterized protein n=1 Tax=Neocucurbitaria cava TaxID=798079 RepID=A0A9W8YE79_9PLEO|nr:hypothetical protein N0V83_001878 [Neocucurbitaria cava]